MVLLEGAETGDTDSRAMPHFGQSPGRSLDTSGCIGQVYLAGTPAGRVTGGIAVAGPAAVACGGESPQQDDGAETAGGGMASTACPEPQQECASDLIPELPGGVGARKRVRQLSPQK